MFAATLAAYWPALHGTLLWDDAGHITRPDLQSLAGLGRIWFEPGATQQYYPLLHSAFWLEHQLWGDATLGYHLVNVFLHATSACLFAAVLRRLAVANAGPSASIRTFGSGGAEWLAALLFALHPVCAESVAWIAEQKNTLSLVLYLCAALTYLRFDSAAGDAAPPPRSSHRGEGAAAPIKPRSARLYWIATALFVAALLTKTVTATLPAALLVIFWWQRGRLVFRRDVVPLLPWFGLSMVAGLTTAWFERTLIGAQGESFSLSLLERALLAGRVAWFYAAKFLWPVDLAFIYPRWTIDAGEAWQWLFPLAALGLLVALWLRRARSRGPLAAALFFGGTLFPALGFVNVFPFVFSWVADHFQYHASLAGCALLAAGAVRGAAHVPRWVALSATGAVLLLLGGLTWQHAANFRDVFTLYGATLEKNPACWMAHNNLAIALVDAGRAAEALPHYEKALAARPRYAEAENNFGFALNQLGRQAEALPHLDRALQLQPRYADAHNNRGAALMALGRAADGIAAFNEAARLRPGFALAHRNLGLAYLNTQRAAEALAPLTRAIELQPDYAQAHAERGIALTVLRRYAESITSFESALRIDPALADAHQGLGFALRALGRNEEAEPHEREAQRLRDPLGGPTQPRR